MIASSTGGPTRGNTEQTNPGLVSPRAGGYFEASEFSPKSRLAVPGGSIIVAVLLP
jgi:hypothetical protein